MDKLFVRLMEKKIRDTTIITKNRNESKEITNFTEIRTIIRGYYEQFNVANR